MTRTVYICSAKRSAIGKAYKGALRSKRPDDFGAEVIKGMLAATPKFDYKLIDDVYIGCAMPEAEQGMNVARFILLLAGLPESVPGVTVNRFCCSGVQTISMAADRIMAGNAECIIAGGAESMTLIPMMGHKVVGSRKVNDDHPDFYLGMGLTAENVAHDYKVTRQEQDEFSFRSHDNAVKAIKNGWFKDEIVPITVESRRPAAGGQVKIDKQTFEVDEGPRADSTVQALGALRAAFKAGGTVTAGNSSQMSDGAAMCIVASEDFVKKHGLKPQARFVGYEVAGVPPRVMGIGPIEAIPKVLKKAGLQLKDVDRFELNEAFAAQALAVVKHLGVDPSKVNPTGGAIALGHPLGATGAKLTATLLNGMARDKQKYGMVSMCIGTGMGAAALFEKV